MVSFVENNCSDTFQHCHPSKKFSETCDQPFLQEQAKRDGIRRLRRILGDGAPMKLRPHNSSGSGPRKELLEPDHPVTKDQKK